MLVLIIDLATYLVYTNKVYFLIKMIIKPLSQFSHVSHFASDTTLSSQEYSQSEDVKWTKA